MNITAIISKRSFPLGLTLLIFIVLFTLPVYGSNYSVVLLTGILLYIILTLSWTIFSGPTGYISLASAAFFGVGMYAMALLGKEFPLAVAVLAGGLISACLALLTGALTLRLRGMYFIMFTFGLSQLIKHVVLWYESHITGTTGRYIVIIEPTTVYYYILVIFAATLLAAYYIRRSKLGLALQSIGENEDAAIHMGVNVTLVKIIAFGVSAFFMGAAGAIMATRWIYIEPSIAFNVLYSFMPVLMAIFGGMAQLYGPILGGAVFAYLEEILITRFPYYYMLLFGIVLVISVLYLPDGLVGLVQGWRRGIRKRQRGYA
jgi:branched-chain amino acid transport system permease protein